MNNLLAISTYPTKDTLHTGGGLAIYTKNTLLAIKKADKNKKIIVLANIIDRSETYTEKGITVIRCWHRNSPFLYLSLLKQIFLLGKTKDILVGFEFATYGDIFITAFLPLFLNFLKALGKNIVSVIHQVVPNIANLSTHAGLNPSNSNINFLNKGIQFFFKIMSLASTKIVTLEPELAKRFNKITGNNKAIAIPHGLHLLIPEKRELAINNLNLNPKHLYVLAFGYLSHYKGTDLIIKAFKKPISVNGKAVKLLLAGGESPTQGQKPHYQSFYKHLYGLINDNESIIHTGFIPQEKIKHIFSGVDLVVFPYRTFMSASGPISLALGHGKPILVSNKLANYSPNTFALNSSSLRKQIIKTLSNKKTLKTLTNYSKQTAKVRNFNTQGKLYLQLF